jgi:hypothetical protein
MAVDSKPGGFSRPISRFELRTFRGPSCNLPTEHTYTYTVRSQLYINRLDGSPFGVFHTLASDVLASDVTPSKPNSVDAIRVGGLKGKYTQSCYPILHHQYPPLQLT